jgi:hypothetical protein
MRTISRRRLLRALGASGAVALLAVAGCTTPAPPTEAPKPTVPPAGAPTAAAAPKPQTETKPAAAAPAAAGGKQGLTLLWHWGKQQTDFPSPTSTSTPSRPARRSRSSRPPSPSC